MHHPEALTTSALPPPLPLPARRAARAPAGRRWRGVAASCVVAAFGLGAVAVALDGCESLLWSRDVYSFVSLRFGLLALLVAIFGALFVGGALRTLAWLVLLAGLLFAVTTLPLWFRFSYPVDVLRELPLPDGRTVTACHVHTAIFQDDFVAVRVERRWLGLWRVDYLARGPVGDVSLERVDDGHVRVRFTPANEHDVDRGPLERLLAIPLR